MAVNDPLPISASVDVAAPPAAVWEVVRDVLRMPEFSPELRRLYAVGRGRPRVGSTLLGLNRRGLAVWPTRSVLTRLEEERAVAWRTRESGATWTYELEPLDGGSATRLTARRELRSYNAGTALLAPALGGAAGHDRELADGLGATLDRIRTAVEVARQPAPRRRPHDPAGDGRSRCS